MEKNKLEQKSLKISANNISRKSNPQQFCWGFFVLFLFLFSTTLAQNKTDSFYRYAIKDGEKIFSALLIDTIGAGDIDILISCHDTANNQLWSKTYGGANTELVNGVLLHDTLLIVYGITRSSSLGIYDYFILILNKDGEFIDDIVFGSSDFETGKDMFIVNNIIYFLGAANSTTTINKIEIANDTLLLLETLKLTSTANQSAEFFTLNKKNELIITGNLTYNSSFQKDMFYIKLDSNFNVISSKKYGDTTEVQLAKCTIDEQDNIYIVGFSYFENIMNSFTAKIDSNGNLINNKSFGTFLIEKAYEVQILDNKLYVGGYTQSTTGTYDDGFLLKLDTDLRLKNTLRINLSNDEYLTQIQFENDFLRLSGPLKYTSIPSWSFFSIEVDTALNGCDDINWQVDEFQNNFYTQDFNFALDSITLLIDTITMLYQNSNIEITPYICNLPRTDSVPDSTKISLKNDIENLLIYPNPVKNILKIKSNTSPVERIEIYNLSGALVFTSTTEPKNEILLKIDNLKEGVYILKIIEKEKITVHKLVVY